MDRIKLTIIGAGNIGGATARGLSGAADITVTAHTQATLDRFAGTGMATTLDNNAAVRGADIVVFAVKPWLMREVIEGVLPDLDLASQTIVSMAPGVPSADLLQWLGPDVHLAYVIPNTAIEVRQSMTFVVPVTTDEACTRQLSTLFENAGAVMTVKESQLLAGTSVASCGIAYAMRYIHAAAQGGVELGLYPADAVKAAAQTVMGAAALLEARGSHPEAEIDKVTTPGGLTIRGLNAMEEAGFSAAVVKGLKAIL